MRRTLAGMLLAYCIAGAVHAQPAPSQRDDNRSPSLYNKACAFPDRLFGSINHKSAQFQQKLHGRKTPCRIYSFKTINILFTILIPYSL